jgi:hypothetical protein
MVVTSVREGLADAPSHGGVARDVSTKVIVVVETGATTAALAMWGKATGDRTPKATARATNT